MDRLDRCGRVAPEEILRRSDEHRLVALDRWFRAVRIDRGLDGGDQIADIDVRPAVPAQVRGRRVEPSRAVRVFSDPG